MIKRSDPVICIGYPFGCVAGSSRCRSRSRGCYNALFKLIFGNLFPTHYYVIKCKVTEARRDVEVLVLMLMLLPRVKLSVIRLFVCGSYRAQRSALLFELYCGFLWQ